MTQPSTCLTQLTDDLENHGHLLALLTELPTLELSERGRIGLLQFSTHLIKEFESIELRFKDYRASVMPNS
jgi:hypothetical protein